MFKKVVSIFVVALLAVVVGVAACARDKKYEKTIAKDQVPQPVIAAFEKAFPNVTVKEYSQMTKEDKVWYSIVYVDGTLTKEVRYRADGTLIGAVEDIAAKDLPEAVRNAIAAKYPDETIVDVETEVHDGVVQYKIKLDAKGNKHEVRFNDKGEIVPKHEH